MFPVKGQMKWIIMCANTSYSISMSSVSAKDLKTKGFLMLNRKVRNSKAERWTFAFNWWIFIYYVMRKELGLPGIKKNEPTWNYCIILHNKNIDLGCNRIMCIILCKLISIIANCVAWVDRLLRMVSNEWTKKFIVKSGYF